MGIVERYKERVKQRLRDYAIIEAYYKRRQKRLDWNEEQGHDPENGHWEEVPDSQKAEEGSKEYEGVEKNRYGYTGFRDNITLERHLKYHGDEPPFVGMDKKEYEKFSMDFLNKEVDGDRILGFEGKDKDTGKTYSIRFDKETGIFAKGYHGGEVQTCFVPGYWIDINDKSLGHESEEGTLWSADTYFTQELNKRYEEIQYYNHGIKPKEGGKKK